MITRWHYVSFFLHLHPWRPSDLMGNLTLWPPADKLITSIWGRSSVPCSLWNRYGKEGFSDWWRARVSEAGAALWLYNSCSVLLSYLISSVICLDSHLVSLRILCPHPCDHIWTIKKYFPNAVLWKGCTLGVTSITYKQVWWFSWISCWKAGDRLPQLHILSFIHC